MWDMWICCMIVGIGFVDFFWCFVFVVIILKFFCVFEIFLLVILWKENCYSVDSCLFYFFGILVGDVVIL